jgi:dipeptidyl aminopeptidase/acylaminoacyl peptidase
MEMRAPIFALLLLFAATLSAQAKRVVTHEDIWLLKRVGNPVISPKGDLTVFSVVEPAYDNSQQTSDLWMVPTDGSKPAQRLTASKSAESSVIFSPDGQKIAFVSRRDGDEASQIYILHLFGGEAQRITNISTGASNPKWSPDGKQILFESMVYPGAKSDAENKKIAAERKARKWNARIYDSMPMRYWDTWLDDRKPHVFVVNSDGGETKDLLAGTDFIARKGVTGFNDGLSSGQTLQAVWTPDGTGVVFAAVLNRDEMMHTLSEAHLFQVSLSGGEPAQVSLGNDDYSRPMFSPDGKTLYAYNSRRGGKRLYSLTRLAAMAWPNGSIKVVTENWDRSVDSVAFSPDSQTVYISAEDSGSDRLFALIDGSMRTILEPKQGGFGGLSVAKDNLSAVATYSSAIQPAEIVSIDLKSGTHRNLTNFNQAKLAELELSPIEHFWFTAKNGKNVHSVIVLPPFLDKSKKYPLILFPHGGPNSMSKDAFSTRWNYHLLTAPGYALLMTNYSGSTGFGEQFADDVERDVLRGPVQETLEAAEEALKRYPFLDSKRQAAMGASYGGYFMNWLQGHTTHFRCFVNHAGAVNNESQYGVNDGGLERELRMGGPIWDMKGQWIDQSPIRYSGKWQTPMLITQGEQDFRVPMGESMTSFKLLQRRKVPAKVAFFPDENHWILKGENNKLHMQLVSEWLKKYLMPDQPAWKWESR